MKWIDIQDIVYCLIDKYPDLDPNTMLLSDLLNMVCTLEEFDDSPEKCGERILEAIQALWIEEAD